MRNIIIRSQIKENVSGYFHGHTSQLITKHAPPPTQKNPTKRKHTNTITKL